MGKCLFIQCQDIGTSKCLYMQHPVVYLCSAQCFDYILPIFIFLENIYCQYSSSKKLYIVNTRILRKKTILPDIEIGLVKSIQIVNLLKFE